MYGVRHHISKEFPEFSSKIEQLMNHDQEFARLLNKYDETDKMIFGYEQLRQPVPGTYLEQLKKWRLNLKDQLYAILRNRQQPQQAMN